MKLVKKGMRFVRNICRVIILLIIALLAICFVYNLICSRNREDGIISYGERVSVKGHSMNVTIEGDKDETIVLLPGYGTAAPTLDFKNLMEELRSDYRVVSVEPFGYGLSDVIDEERSIEAMTEELHMCLQELGVETYILAGHSIAGVYGLYYIQKYGEEVKGYVGLDTSVPYQIHQGNIPTWIYPILKKSGIYQAMVNLAPEGLALPWLTQEENQWLAQITLNNLGNKNIISEGKLFTKNLEKVQGMQYPINLPVIFFLASESVDAHDFWKREHENMIADLTYGEIVILDGPHYIHHEYAEEIGQKLHDFGEYIKDEQGKNKG